MLLLKDKVALVTGASRGIGKSIALAFAEQGARVAGTATTFEGAERISAFFKELKLDGKGFILNLSDEASRKSLLENLDNHFKSLPSLLVNNAGITRDNLLLRMKDNEWDAVIETNLSAVFRLTRSCIRTMCKNEFGRIINISSIVGCTGNVGQANYAAAKAGLIGLTKSLALEFAKRHITANVVAPGFIETDMTNKLDEKQKEILFKRIPMDRLGCPEDVAHACVFLASPWSAYISGQTLHVNGGMYMN